MSTEIGTWLISTPNVCGGRLRIDGMRITINQIATLYKHGLNAEEIVDQFSHLTLAQVYAALSHYHANQREIDSELESEKKEAERLEQQYQSSRAGLMDIKLYVDEDAMSRVLIRGLRSRGLDVQSVLDSNKVGAQT